MKDISALRPGAAAPPRPEPGRGGGRTVRLMNAGIIAVSLLLPPQHAAGRRSVPPEVQKSPLLFYHESASSPGVRSLLKEFGFDEYVSPGANEFERMILLKEWVYTAIPYGLNYNAAELRDAVRVLRRARRGESFLCTNLAAVYNECAVSLGWTARSVYLRKPTGEEHAGNDIWSNQYRKWVYIDTTWNMHVERGGMPLGIQEIRREWIRNRGRDLVYVFGAGARARRYGRGDLPVVRRDSAVWRLMPLGKTWIEYTFQVAVVGRNDFVSRRNARPERFWDLLYLLRDRFNRKDRTWPFLRTGKAVPPGRLFHELNRVDVTVPYHRNYRRGPLVVTLDGFGPNNYSPNFMHYEVSANGGAWEPVPYGVYTWLLEPGPNLLQARVMNRFGVPGPATEKRITVPGSPAKRTAVRVASAPR